MIVNGEAQVRCGQCGEVAYIPGLSLNMEQAWGDERQMGTELGYKGCTAIECAHCEKNISVTYEVTEYPIGVVNFAEATVSGGTLLKGFSDIDIHYKDEIYSFEKEINLHLPEEKKIITSLEVGAYSLLRAIEKNPELIRKIDSRNFEEIIATIFSKNGFAVELTKKTRDGGRDIIAIRSDLGIRSKFLIECKRYSATNPITVELVRNLYGVQMQEGANKSVLATTSYFTAPAKKFASATNTTEWGMDLRDFDDVIQWIKQTRA